MFQEFPDDNRGDDFLNEFRQKIAEQPVSSFEERRNELNRSKSVFIGAVSGVVLAGIVGWFVLSPRYAEEAGQEIPVIRRPQTAIKVQPTEPGGMEILNQDKSVYGIIDKNDTASTVENLLPPPEEPKLPVIAPSEDTVVKTAGIADIIDETEKDDVSAQAEKIIQVAEAPKPVAVKEEPAPVKTESLSEAMGKVPVAVEEKTQEAKVEVPAPKPAAQEKTKAETEVKDAPIAAGSWQVQLMSSNQKGAVEKSWKQLTSKYDVLKNQPHEVEKADLGAKGIYYRLKAGAFKDRSGADALCNDIKALGGTCIVKKK